MFNSSQSTRLEAKRLFERLAGEFPISIAMLDINSPDGQELAVQSGILIPPGIFVGGEPLCYGRPSERMAWRHIEGKLSIGVRRHDHVSKPQSIKRDAN